MVRGKTRRTLKKYKNRTIKQRMISDVKEGDFVWYKNKNNKQKSRIVKIHYDDIEPYYTILLNEHEKQTTKNRLFEI